MTTKTKIIFSFITLFLAVLETKAQFKSEFDSLTRSLKNNISDTAIAIKYIALATKEQNSDLDNAYEHSKSGFEISDRYNFKKGLAYYYKTLASIQDDLDQDSLALINYDKGLQYAEEINDYRLKAKIFQGKGIILGKNGKLIPEIEYELKAKSIGQQLNDIEIINVSTAIIGRIFLKQKQFKEALTNFKEFLYFAEKSKNHLYQSKALHNIGAIYIEIEKYDSAIFYLTKSTELKEEIGDRQNMPTLLVDLANAYLGNNNLIKATEISSKAENVAKEINDSAALGRVLIAKAGIEESSGNSNKAISYLEDAAKIFEKRTLPLELESAYENLADLYEENNDYKKSLKYFKLLKQVQDSSYNLKSKKIINELNIKYESSQKDLKLEKQNTEIKRRNNQILIGLIIFGALAAFSLIAYFIKKIGREKTEKNIMDAQYKVSSNLFLTHFSASRLTNLQSIILNGSKDASEKYLMKLSKFLRQIMDFINSKEVSLKEDLDILEEYIIFEKQSMGQSLNYELKYADKVVPEDIYIPPLLIQPFVENSIQHGFKEKKEPCTLKINIGKIGNELIVIIEDNGLGRKMVPIEEKTKKSFGLQITKDRLDYYKKLNRLKASYQILDMKDGDGMPTGTKVILKIQTD